MVLTKFGKPKEVNLAKIPKQYNRIVNTYVRIKIVQNRALVRRALNVWFNQSLTKRLSLGKPNIDVLALNQLSEIANKSSDQSTHRENLV